MANNLEKSGLPGSPRHSPLSHHWLALPRPQHFATEFDEFLLSPDLEGEEWTQLTVHCVKPEVEAIHQEIYTAEQPLYIRFSVWSSKVIFYLLF